MSIKNSLSSSPPGPRAPTRNAISQWYAYLNSLRPRGRYGSAGEGPPRVVPPPVPKARTVTDNNRSRASPNHSWLTRRSGGGSSEGFLVLFLAVWYKTCPVYSTVTSGPQVILFQNWRLSRFVLVDCKLNHIDRVLC